MLKSSFRVSRLLRCAPAGLTVVLLILTAAACSPAGEPAGRASGAAPSIPAPADVAAAPSDASVTPTGLASKVIAPGRGTRHPRANSRVTVHYTGWTVDGKMFDSSRTADEPISFALDEVIPGWTQGLQMMVEGEQRRFWIPARLAYEGTPDKPQGTLVFDVELVRIDS